MSGAPTWTYTTIFKQSACESLHGVLGDDRGGLFPSEAELDGGPGGFVPPDRTLS